MSQFNVTSINTTRRTKSGSAIVAIIDLPEKHAAEQLPKELALELTGQAVAFAIVDRGNKLQAPKGDLTQAAVTPPPPSVSPEVLAALVAQAVAQAMAELKKK